MSLLSALSTLFLVLALVLCAGTVARYLFRAPFGPSRVEEIRRLRHEGLAVHQEGEH